MSDMPATPVAPITARNPWAWVPSLYFAQGLPFVMVTYVAVVMYNRLGVSNAKATWWASLLGLPWVIKPLWSPIVDLVGTKRLWITAMQALMAGIFVVVALAIPGPRFFQYTVALLGAMAFCSASHDIAADGFYMLGLQQHQQAAFVGVRSTFWRIAWITGEGGLVILAGLIERLSHGNVRLAWVIATTLAAVLLGSASFYHWIALPRPASDGARIRFRQQGIGAEFLKVFAEFFRKDQSWLIIAFLLLYRANEGLLIKLTAPFLLAARDRGGLGLTTLQVGLVKGTIGVAAMLAGGILGGVVIARHGLKRWLWPMVLLIHLSDLAYIMLAWAQPENRILIGTAVGMEQFGYGFSFTAYTVFMIMTAEGNHKTAHYAICTGFMALSTMLPGMASGWLQEHLGYRMFFLCILLTVIPGVIVAALARIPPEFGKKGAQLPEGRRGFPVATAGNIQAEEASTQR